MGGSGISRRKMLLGFSAMLAGGAVGLNRFRGLNAAADDGGEDGPAAGPEEGQAEPSPSPLDDAPTPVAEDTPLPPSVVSLDASANRLTYRSGQAQVQGYFFRPEGAGPFPAVLVLHSRGGLSLSERRYASWLASQGYVALAPDYFAPIGMTAAAFDPLAFFVSYPDIVRPHLAAGVECLKSLPYVSPDRVAAIGFSLGGYFMLLMAARDDIKAGVGYYGAYVGHPNSPMITKYPMSQTAAQVKGPILMLHGDADDEVRIGFAYATRDLLLKAGKRVELIVYPGANHSFNFPRDARYDPQVTADADRRTLAFLKANVG